MKTTSNGRWPPMEENLQWKMTSNRRKFSTEDNLQLKRTSNGRQSSMEDNLKILNVEYLSNQCIKTYEFLGGN
jgi:hypothetical protein